MSKAKKISQQGEIRSIENMSIHKMIAVQYHHVKPGTGYLSRVLLDQIRTADKTHFLLKKERIAKLTEKEMLEIEEKLFMVLKLRKNFTSNFLLKELTKRVTIKKIAKFSHSEKAPENKQSILIPSTREQKQVI
ncbi:hypothetical protein C2G38_2180126 [Gigaspora rosea]|uniref:Uncharacterized protein n=1 Tax=Gigaspora rosea TaxID=44941 RepID=A0A397VCA5_9GLOM|nr:hypothetical protein C2G38_2180126 [Gigaspora rosea]